MTRFRELQRIEAAIKHKDKNELNWALEYCEMRIRLSAQFSRRLAQEKHWRNIEKQVRNAILQLEQDSNSN